MHSCVTSKNAKWCHLIWPTLYVHSCQCAIWYSSGWWNVWNLNWLSYFSGKCI